MKELKDALICILLASIIVVIFCAIFSAKRYNEFSAERHEMEKVKFNAWVYRQNEYLKAQEARKQAEAEKREAMSKDRMEKRK